MGKLVTFLLAALLGAGLPAGLAAPASASVRGSKKQLCAAVSGAGGATTFSQAATSGQRVTELAGSLQKMSTYATSKHLKSELATLAALYRHMGHGSAANLAGKDVAKLDAALADFSSYVAANCASTTPSSTTASSGAGSTAALSGTWSGQYSGANQGTFTLTWQQSGSNLTGTINISEVGAPSGINGTVSGNTITFGTVGTAAVTYSGTVSGNSMSGTYQSPSGSGTWTATKTS
jgi:hypothetical protein